MEDLLTLWRDLLTLTNARSILISSMRVSMYTVRGLALLRGVTAYLFNSVSYVTFASCVSG